MLRAALAAPALEKALSTCCFLWEGQRPAQSAGASVRPPRRDMGAALFHAALCAVLCAMPCAVHCSAMLRWVPSSCGRVLAPHSAPQVHSAADEEMEQVLAGAYEQAKDMVARNRAALDA